MCNAQAKGVEDHSDARQLISSTLGEFGQIQAAREDMEDYEAEIHACKSRMRSRLHWKELETSNAITRIQRSEAEEESMASEMSAPSDTTLPLPAKPPFHRPADASPNACAVGLLVHQKISGESDGRRGGTGERFQKSAGHGRWS